MHAYLHSFFVWIMHSLLSWGYAGIVFFMALESTVVPIPSELIIPPAAYYASQGIFSYPGVVLAGTFGSWLGAAITYFVCAKLGRPLLLRYGKYFFITPEKLELAENWVSDYGTGGIFFARLLPVVRHLVSIPAGLCEQSFAKFSLATILGAGAWCSVLAWFGPHVITPGMLSDAESMMREIKKQMHWIVLLVALVAGLYFVMTLFAKRNRKPAETP